MLLFTQINFPAFLYQSAYHLIIFVLCALTSIYYSFSHDQKLSFGINGKFLNYAGIFLMLSVTVFLGLRPVDLVFVDTQLYADMYNIIDEYEEIRWDNNWMWHGIIVFCKSLGFNVNQYFLLIESVYIGSLFFVCLKVSRHNFWLAALFFFSSFSFYSYGVNGLRNGMACHIVLLGILLLANRDKKWLPVGLLLFAFAYTIHKSILLPFICMLASFYIKDVKNAIAIWGISILLSLIIGNAFGDFIQSIGLFEDKLSYFNDVEESYLKGRFSQTGFRFDFLLYSAMPVLMIWYLTIKRNFKDNVYTILANTYLLANSFWILVIRATFSNRFAYLSWFIYPIIIFYPLIRMNIWEKQDRKTALILILYSGFTFFMEFIYYG